MGRSTAATAILASLVALGAVARADERTEEEELASLLAVLEQETEIATRTKMNSDFVPGMVTVLQGDELLALGARNVGEALGLAPGVMSWYTPDGTPIVTMRGIGFPFNSGNVKLTVDGVSMSQPASAVNSSLLLVPIELVERIEIVRGPGSTIHGEFAFMGVVNVVMRREGRQAHALADALAGYGAGASLAFPGPAGEAALGAALLRGDDTLGTSGFEAEARQGTLFGSFSRHGFQASLHAVDYDRSSTNGNEERERSWVAELRHKAEIAAGFATDVRLSYLDTDSSNPVVTFDGARIAAEASLTCTRLARHTFWLAVGGSSSGYDAELQPPGPPGGEPPPPAVAEDRTRRVFGVSLQDQIDVVETLALVLGARYERFDGGDVEVVPRLAAVWRMTSDQVLKAQYTRGFRSANFFELETGASDIEAETIGTTEISYIVRGASWLGRATAFDARLRGLIHPDPSYGPGPPVFGNVRSARARGAEVEWEQRFSKVLRAIVNVSCVDTEDTREGEARGADLLANLALLARPVEHLLLSARLYHVGSRDTLGTHQEAFDLVDLTVAIEDLPWDGLAIRGGLKNALSEELDLAITVPGLVVEYTLDTRSWWGELSYRF